MNTNGFNDPFVQFDITIDVYSPGMPKEDWIEYQLTVVIVACGTAQGVHLNIVDKDGIAYSEDTPVQYAMSQHTIMYPWKQNNYTSTKDYCPLTYLGFQERELNNFVKDYYASVRQVVKPNDRYPVDNLENPISADGKLINHEFNEVALLTKFSGIIIDNLKTTIGTYNDNNITRDILIYVCGSQTIELNQLSSLRGFLFDT